MTLVKQLSNQFQMVRFCLLRISDDSLMSVSMEVEVCTWYTTLLPCWAIISTRGTARPFSIRQSFSLWEDFLVFLILNNMRCYYKTKLKNQHKLTNRVRFVNLVYV